jgi:hypothetical protein
MLLLYAIVAGLLVGVLLGGRPAALASVRFRWWPVAFAGLLFQLILFSPPVAESVGDSGPALYVGSTALVLVALSLNLRQPGFVVIATGALLNFLVIVANGGQMPASPAAFAALNGLAQVPVEYFSNSQLIGPNTLMPFLGDIFVLPRPFPFANVFSIGDVLIGLGGALFIVLTMRRGQPPAAPRESLDRAVGRPVRATAPHRG